MADDRLTSSLQVSVLAALCFDQGHGAAIATQVRAEHFDQAWRDFAARVLRYRKEYGKPPGHDTSDIAEQVAVGGKSRSLLRDHLLPELFAESESLNAAYAAKRVTDFVRRQVLKAALVEAGDKFATPDQENLIGDVEAILRRSLAIKHSTYKAGTFLNDPNAFRYIDTRDDVIPLGIPELDRLGIGLIAKQVILYIGPKGSGKTWFCIHCGKQALLQGLKVVHYSHEMGEEEVIPRYYQAIFAASRTSEPYPKSVLEFDELGRLSGFKTRWKVKPRLAFSDPGTRKLLRNKMKTFGTRFGGLVVKEFPTGLATVSDITNHLDYLQEVEGFVPNIMIVDYPKLLKADRNNIRVDIGRNVEELRGICVQRNLAGVFPHQGTRQTIGAKRVKSSQAGEDISVVQTADTVLAFSRTEEEERRNLGRLSVEHVRKARGGEVILLSQSYDTGQYVLSSASMQKAYWERMREVTGDDEVDDE